MPDKKDDLLFDEDLTADFLTAEELTNESNKKNNDSTTEDVEDIPAPTDLDTDDPEPEATDETPTPESLADDSEDPSDETNDWIEDSKVDLPGQLALDIYETKDHLFVLCRIAGVDEQNIDVSISADNILNVRGSLIAPKLEANVENYFIQECYWGEFSRSVSLPVDVKKDNIDATLDKGILTISFIKIKQDSIKKIDIKTNK